MEEWIDVPGYEGLYQVSNLGQVKSMRKGRTLSQNPVRGGYLRVCLSKDGKSKGVYVHQLVADAFIGHRDGLEVNHIDGDKRNNQVTNLEWVTRSENIKHSYKYLGRVSPAKGKRIAEKLSADDVMDIRRSNESEQTLAERYGVNWRTIRNTRTGKAYSYLPRPAPNRSHGKTPKDIPAVV